MRADHLRYLKGAWTVEVIPPQGEKIIVVQTNDPQEAFEAFEDCLPGGINSLPETIQLVYNAR